MIVRNLTDLENTEARRSGRDLAVAPPVARRRQDGLLAARHGALCGTETTMEYRNHFEAVYCIEGKATIENHATGEVHEITPG